MLPSDSFNPDDPQPGEAFQIEGVRVRFLPTVGRMLLAVEGRRTITYLVESVDGQRWTLTPRDEHDGLRFVGRPRRDD